MSHPITQIDALKAWIEVCKLIVGQPLCNVNVTIDDPTAFNDSWLTQYDPSKLETVKSTADVVNTIFPYKLRARSRSREDFYLRYLQVYSKAKPWSRNRRTWGTYFERMIKFGSKEINQLENCIEAIGGWQIDVRTPFVIHTCTQELDTLRPQGMPCLQYVQFFRDTSDRLSLFAVYRNHDFFSKALGNYIGLCKLLEFVATETQSNVGSVICQSVVAFCSAPQKQLRKLAGI